MNPRLYIGNLSPDVTEAALRRLFSQAGTVTEVTLMLDPATSQSRGFAFVTMATAEWAAAALSNYHGYLLGGRYITVTEARPPQAPQGMMSEGFTLGAATGLRPSAPREKKRPRSLHSSRRHGRSR